MRLTRRRAEAALAAIQAMLAGEEHEGDWPEDVSRADLEGAEDAIAARLASSARRRSGEKHLQPAS